MDTILNQISQRFGSTLRKSRKAQGLTQIALAQACGMALGTVKRIEQGEGMSAAADQIADHLGQALVARASPRALRHEALRTLRLRRGLSQRDLARLSGVARNSLIRLERGLDVRLPVLGAVGRALGAGLAVMPKTSLGQFFATTAHGSAYHGWLALGRGPRSGFLEHSEDIVSTTPGEFRQIGHLPLAALIGG